MFSDFMESLDMSSSEFAGPVYDMVADEDRKKYVCKQAGCGKIFRYKSEIERHIATHSESRPFVCQYENCFKAFKRADALENHIRSSHTKETPFACPFPECGMKFTTHGSFRYHVLKHNKQHQETETLTTPHEPVHAIPQARKQVKLSSPPQISVPVTNEFQSKDPFSSKFSNPFEAEFSAQPLRFASNVRWEMVDDEAEPSSPVQKTEDSQAERLNLVMEENTMLKQRLTTSEKVIKSMQKQINELLNSLFAYQSQFEPIPTTSVFPDFVGQSEQLTQDSPVEAQFKPEEPSFNMINYGEDIDMLPPSEPKFRQETSIDAFLSFGNSFDF